MPQSQESAVSPLRISPTLEASTQAAAPASESPDILKLKKDFLSDVILLEDELQKCGGSGITVEQIVEHISFRLEEIIERQGAEPISGEMEFNCLRHSAIPPRFVNDGTPIEETLVNGWCIGKFVLRKAKVKIASDLGKNIKMEPTETK